MPTTIDNQRSAITYPISPWLVAMTVMLATFMEALDTSVANVALPHIAGGLAVDVQESTWVLTPYLVSNAIVLPLSGWLSSRFGRKNVFLVCVALFSISSFLCGIAPSLSLLIVFRIFQGMGGGAMQPISQAILLESFPPGKRGVAMGVFGMGVVVAPIVGPTLGGWISDNLSWRWIFLINIPVGMLVARVQARYLIMAALLIVAYSMFYMSGFNLQIDFRAAVTARSITGAGLAFLFVPINAAAFYYIAKENTGQGTAIINLMRNIGGSFGIAFVTTLLARRMQMHQSLLVRGLTSVNPAYNQAVAHIQTALMLRGVSPSQAAIQTSGILEGMLTRQAAIQAYDDVFQLLGLLSLALVPFMSLLKKTRPGAGGSPGLH